MGIRIRDNGKDIVLCGTDYNHEVKQYPVSIGTFARTIRTIRNNPTEYHIEATYLQSSASDSSHLPNCTPVAIHQP